jgi:signal transduction histidine kinase
MPVTTRRPGDVLDEQLRRLDRVLPFPMLAVSTGVVAVATATGYKTWARFEFGLIFVGLAALWMLFFVTLHPEWDERRDIMTGYYVGRTLIGAVLVGVNPWFALFAFVGYVEVRWLPDRWAFAGIGATALQMAAAQEGGYPPPKLVNIAIYLALTAINFGLAATFGYVSSRVVEQNDERGDMIEQLAETNRQLEAALAENTGLHAQLLAQAREAGILDERQRMAGEIHDTLAQGLTGIVTQLEAAEQALANQHAPDEWQRHIDLARALARESLTEARRSVRALRPEQLDGAPLPDAIAGLAHDWSQRSAVAVHVETTGDCRRLAPDTEATLFRVAQESLTNVAKHAQASKVWLTLSYLDDVALLDIRDDGVGFDPDARRPDGYGIDGMRRRLQRVAGSLEVESAPGEGTAINASVPVGAA